MGHVKLTLELPVLVHSSVSLNFARKLAVVQVLFLEQLSLPSDQPVSPPDRSLSCLLHVPSRLRYLALVAGAELSLLSLEDFPALASL